MLREELERMFVFLNNSENSLINVVPIPYHGKK